MNSAFVGYEELSGSRKGVIHLGLRPRWLGLNDIFTEGSFSWVDRGAGNFTAWC